MTHPYTPDAPGTVPVGGWTPWGTWDPTAGRAPAVPPAPTPVTAPAPASRVLPAALLAGGLALGLVLAAVVGALVLRGAADDAGRAAGEAMGEAVGETLYGGVPSEYYDYGTGGGPGEVEQSEPVPPGVLGSDPLLDAHAQGCFDGDLQACDDLFAESPPLSEYEEYALTCGGRVKAWSVPLCTDLD
ncbi:hypothetical protein GCM10027261_00280 [Geodermatophilus arenarius]|uniref:Uncharacterized protein n=1 Tax=Geodermatophilus arenarius TaxID=1137990 RepID=A0ABV9LPD1_9ACTN